MSPRSGRQLVNARLSPAPRARILFLILPWGLRPRLYSATCSAGSGHNMLSVTYIRRLRRTSLNY